MFGKDFSHEPAQPVVQNERFEQYWLWHGMFSSYKTLKNEDHIHAGGKRKRDLQKQIFLQYVKNFFKFPVWFFSLLIPNFFKGEENIWTNLRTMWRLMMSREFKPLRMAVLSQFVFLFAIASLGYTVFYKYSHPTYAATYTFTQSSWSGGSSTSTASHPGDKTGWTSYSSASSTLSVGSDIILSFTIATSSDSTDQDFSSWTTSSVAISGSGSEASFVLLKPSGASCSTGIECNSGVCDGSNQCYEPPCAFQTSITYSGQTYDLVEIGTQCWFADHLNVGTKLASGSTMPSNNSLIEKWCYNNSDASCATNGGLYTWAEAMQLDPSCNTTSCVGQITANHQGICPSGWHIPTDDEIKILEGTVDTSYGVGNSVWNNTGYRGSDVGTKLKFGGSSGFAAVLSGYRNISGPFFSQGSDLGLWFASENSSTHAWGRYAKSSSAQIGRYNFTKTVGFAVRCLKD